jgi:hypothetical protein
VAWLEPFFGITVAFGSLRLTFLQWSYAALWNPWSNPIFLVVPCASSVALSGRQGHRRTLVERVLARNKVMQTTTENIRVIMFQDGDQWVAQCLEYDLGAQAPDIDTLNDRITVLIKAELKESIDRHDKPFGGIPPAPARFQHMWERRVRSVEVSPAPWMRGKANLNFALVA